MGYNAVAESAGLKPKDVKSAVEGILTLAAEQMKKSGSFKLAGMLNLKLKVRPATKARKGVNPFTKEPCVFKAKPASKTVKAIPMKKCKEMVNGDRQGTVAVNQLSSPRWAAPPGP